MFAMLWVHHDFVFICDPDVLKQFPFIKFYFLSQKEHLINLQWKNYSNVSID